MSVPRSSPPPSLSSTSPPPEPTAPPRGFPFQAVELLGRGSSGAVWRALDPVRGEIAVKLIEPALGEAAREQLRRERHVLASVRHPRVVRVLGLLEEPALALLLELVPGRPFLEALDGGRRPGPAERGEPRRVEQIVALLLQLLDALAAVHDAGLVHRDVKPANVRVSPTGTLKLLDLGLAAEALSLPTGTLRYMPPEVLAGRPADPRCDLYAVGAMAYEALTGDVPFGDRRNAHAFAAARLNLEPPAPHDLDPAIPPGLSRAVASLVARHPGDRPASARAAARLLAGALHAAAAPAPATPERVTSAVTVDDPPLVARAREANELALAAGAAFAAGCPASILVVGAEGSGKTRLAGDWTAALDRGVLVLRVEGRGEVRPLAAFAPAIEGVAAALAGVEPLAAAALLPRTARALEAVSPRASQLPGFDLLPPLVAVAPDDALARTSDALVALLAAVAGTRPVALLAESVDEATAETRRVLSRLAPSLQGPLALVATARSDEPAHVRDLGREARIELAPLAAGDAALLAAAALHRPPGALLLAWLADAAEGNPQHVLDALHAAARAGALTVRDDRVELDPAIGARLDASSWLAPLLDSLAPAPRTAARALAVLGSGARLDDIVAVARLDAGRAARAIQALLVANMLREEGGRLRFRVDALRASVLASIPDAARRTLHARAAARAERASDAGRAATDWLEAGRPARALRHLVPAVREALDRGDARRAHELASAGLDGIPADRRRSVARATVRILRARAAILLGRAAEAEVDVAAARGVVERAARKDDALRRDLLGVLWERAFAQGHRESLVPDFQRYLAEAEARGDRSGVAFAHDRLSELLRAGGDFRAAEEHARAALSFHLRLGNHAAIAYCVNALSIALTMRGDLQLALRHLRRALRIARLVGLTRLEGLVLQNTGACLEALGHRLEAVNVGREALAVARRAGDVPREGTLEMNLGVVLQYLGRYGEAGEAFDRAEKLLRVGDRTRILAHLAFVRGALDLRLGSIREAIRSLDTALATSDLLGRDYLPKMLLLRAEARWLAGDASGTVEDIASARSLGRELGTDWTDGEAAWQEARLRLGEGRGNEAAALARAALADAERRKDLPVVARARTLLALATGDAATADQAVRDAVDSGEADTEIGARLALVQLLERAGRTGEATIERARGVELVESIAAQAGPGRETFLARPDVRALRGER